MSKDDHKIDADDRTVFDVLNERKYTVDYFQREYSWEQKHEFDNNRNRVGNLGKIRITP